MTKKRRLPLALTLLIFAIVLFPAANTRAEAVGDSALLVGLSTLSGAVLGASTLPFYEDSGAHTKNIFYGAAIGAVIGVGIAAYSGVKDGPGFDDASLRRPTPESALSLNEAPQFRLKGERSVAQRRPASFAANSALLWSPLGTVRF